MQAKTLRVFFESLNQTFTVEPLGSLFKPNQYWVVEEERDEWYRVTGFPTCIMMLDESGGKNHGFWKNQQVFCHSEAGVKIGRVV